MNLATTLKTSLTSSPIVAATVYAALVVVLLTMAISSMADIFSQRASVAASAAMLEQLEGRKIPVAGSRPVESGAPQGSAFLEGATVTVAGATLLQRVAASVTKLGGNVLSSQLDVQGPHAKAGFVSMVANCEMDQAALQGLLYDLEAGMPFLFIDQLDIQVSQGSTGEGKLRFLLGVSGQWQGAK